jgi:hypothetical protein
MVSNIDPAFSSSSIRERQYRPTARDAIFERLANSGNVDRPIPHPLSHATRIGRPTMPKENHAFAHAKELLLLMDDSHEVFSGIDEPDWAFHRERTASAEETVDRAFDDESEFALVGARFNAGL